MAKKNKKEKFNFTNIGSLIDNLADQVSMHVEDGNDKRKYIDTGVYLLNAAFSADMINGGVEYGKIFTLAGDSGTGKSFLALSTAKNAQRQGMGVIYIDTEYSMRLSDLPNYGIDISPEKFKLLRGNKVEDINILLTQLLDDLKTEKKKNGSVEPFLIILDSVGQMSSNKEKEDLLKGDIKVDMTRAKALAAMFRSINVDLGILNIPMIVCNHVYLTQDFFPQEVLKGGKGLVYSSSVICMLSKKKLRTGEEDDMDLNQSGITVTAKTTKNRLAKPKKIQFDISFIHGMNQFTGLEAFCRPEFYDKIGIAKGEEVVDKTTGEVTFKKGGNKYYVRHLGKKVWEKELFNNMIFTDEVLKAMAPIVNNYFKFKSVEEQEEAQREFEKIMDEDEFNGFTDADAEDLFD